MTFQIEQAFLSDDKTQRGKEMISLYKFDKIRSLHATGKSQRSIAKELKVSRKTVKVYIEPKTGPLEW